MKIRPLHDRILAKRLAEKDKTAGGLFIPDTAKEKPLEALVVSVGSGKVLENGYDAAALGQGRRPRAHRQVLGLRSEARR